jgi:hypothetical protein
VSRKLFSWKGEEMGFSLLPSLIRYYLYGDLNTHLSSSYPPLSLLIESHLNDR